MSNIHDFTFSNYLSFNNLFYIKKEGKFIIDYNYNNIISKIEKNKREIDPAAVVEFINCFYFFADRTIIKGIKKTPWMGYPSESNNSWIYWDIPPHSNKIAPIDEIAGELVLRLKKELLSYINNHSVIGILLSGGMDSRIVAGIIDILRKEKKIKADIIGLTWGIPESRDVHYAEEICKKLCWEWIHFPLTPENIIENMAITIEIGCEAAPLHFHTIPRVREQKGIDCIIAASFGDSIGRAEYSGSHVTKRKSLLYGIRNRFGLINNDIFKATIHCIKKDIKSYRELFKRQKEYQYCEIELQAHYMRRQLNPVISYIGSKIKFYQAFTSPDVYGYMWGLSPVCRNDLIYKYILKNILNPVFYRIPWARTGKFYHGKERIDTLFLKENNYYGKWIRNDLYEIVKNNILSDTIINCGIFNEKALEKIFKIACKEKTDKANRLDQLILWIASLKDFIEKYDIVSKTYNKTVKDMLNSITGPVTALGYLAVKKLL